MAVYQWVGKNRLNKVQKGEMEATSEEAVRASLARQKIMPTRIKAKPKDLFENVKFLQPRVKESDIILFARQFSTMIDAGLPIIQCLDILYSQQSNATFKKVLKQVKESVEGGATLAEALMAVYGIGLKVNTLPVVALGVGIGVDYGIYIYNRLDILLKEGFTLREAYYRTLRLTGRAVIFTGFTLGAGVGTWIFSPLQFQADMGILLSFIFLANMVGAIVLLPALVRWLLMRKRNTLVEIPLEAV